MQKTDESPNNSVILDVPGFFDYQDPSDISPNRQSDKSDTHRVGVKEAARLLGITERTVWRQIKRGKLAAQLIDGHTLVTVSPTDTPGQVSTGKPDTDTNGQATMSADTDHDADTVSRINSPQASRLIDMIQNLHEKLESATYRNGYLESQLSERDQQIKLLTDSQTTKRTLVHRFVDWLKGGR